ncbi:hypothetical protein BDW42DRAFT_174385 [Aspergillus taichungensis]|uniref:Transmembrane protein n=1 Tax=Aspergillus taichungensis TaxID=482145 RepID=A0A2J5HNB1_9EURO|nr:hypothetical protein BDW42DRAFT_174385 [Aspergillus taichungensis]
MDRKRCHLYTWYMFSFSPRPHSIGLFFSRTALVDPVVVLHQQTLSGIGRVSIANSVFFSLLSLSLFFFFGFPFRLRRFRRFFVVEFCLRFSFQVAWSFPVPCLQENRSMNFYTAFI